MSNNNITLTLTHNQCSQSIFSAFYSHHKDLIHDFIKDKALTEQNFGPGSLLLFELDLTLTLTYNAYQTILTIAR